MATNGKPTGASYPIATIVEMAAIPAGTRERFLEELPLILARYAEVLSRYSTLEPHCRSAVWTDDGDDSAEFTIQVRRP